MNGVQKNLIFEVCICTHSPNLEILDKAVEALLGQDIDKGSFEVLIIDNASTPPLSLEANPLAKLVAAGIATRLVREKRLGVAYARIRAIQESAAENIVFVDDDNALAPDFLTQASTILKSHPDVGCFSGIISLPLETAAPKWTKPLLVSLAVRDCGNKEIKEFFRGDWSPWVPTATASMVVRRSVIQVFMENHGENPRFFNFGRKGHNNLTSGEDYLIALSAADAGLKCGYFPQLRMTHWVRKSRFSFWYIARLMKTYGKTDLMKTDYLKLPLSPFETDTLKYRLVLNYRGMSWQAILCFLFYEIVYITGIMRRLVFQGKWPIKITRSV